MAESRYIVDSNNTSVLVMGRPHQFEIEGPPEWLVELAYEAMGGRRRPVRPVQGPHQLLVESAEATEAFNFFSFTQILRFMVRGLMSNWQGRARGVAENKLTAWAMKQTAWALGTRLHAQWQRLVQQADPAVAGSTPRGLFGGLRTRRASGRAAATAVPRAVHRQGHCVVPGRPLRPGHAVNSTTRRRSRSWRAGGTSSRPWDPTAS